MSEGQKAGSLREVMPKTAEWVDRMRAEHGREYVNDCIGRALKGEPGVFYAIEAGQVLGTPFPPERIGNWQNLALVWGCTFAGFLRRPDGGTEGIDDGT